MKCKHYCYILDENDRYYINALEYNNCVFCLVKEKSPMSQEDVAKYFGLSKMRISQIERRAIEKMKKRWQQFGLD